VGVCDPATGVCSDPELVDGTTCDDSDACTQADTCQSGVCTGDDPVTCTALDQCHDVGVCDPATGVCSDPIVVDGTSCEDDDACTLNDFCLAGVCTAGSPPCDDPDLCDEDLEICFRPCTEDAECQYYPPTSSDFITGCSSRMVNGSHRCTECSDPDRDGFCGYEYCQDGVDNDGDGIADEVMESWYSGDPAYTPEFCATELCGNGLDDDSDGEVDEFIDANGDYVVENYCIVKEFCSDGVDNDGDGDTDEPDCFLLDCPHSGLSVINLSGDIISTNLTWIGMDGGLVTENEVQINGGSYPVFQLCNYLSAFAHPEGDWDLYTEAQRTAWCDNLNCGRCYDGICWETFPMSYNGSVCSCDAP
jgi:hypothetical protein